MNWLSVGLKILPFIVTAVKTVESFFKAKGPAKEDAAVSAVAAILSTVEETADRDLMSDERVEKATRDVMKAIVSLQNVIREVRGE